MVRDGVPTFFSVFSLRVVMKRCLPFDPDQPLLLLPDLRDALPDGDSALLIGVSSMQVDASEAHEALEDGRWVGKPGFDPRVLVRIWAYAYAIGIRSSKKVAQAVVQNVAVRVVAHDQTPGRWTLNDFSPRNREALGNLLAQTVSPYRRCRSLPSR